MFSNKQIVASINRQYLFNGKGAQSLTSVLDGHAATFRYNLVDATPTALTAEIGSDMVKGGSGVLTPGLDSWPILKPKSKNASVLFPNGTQYRTPTGDYLLGMDDFYIEIIMRWTTVTAGSYAKILGSVSTDTWWVGRLPTKTQLFYAIYDSATVQKIITTNVATPLIHDQWYYFLCCCDRSSSIGGRIYVNGIQSGNNNDVTTVGDVDVSGIYFDIGGAFPGQIAFVQGWIGSGIADVTKFDSIAAERAAMLGL